MVVAVDRDRAPPPREHRADLVVAGLGELLERQHGPERPRRDSGVGGRAAARGASRRTPRPG